LLPDDESFNTSLPIWEPERKWAEGNAAAQKALEEANIAAKVNANEETVLAKVEAEKKAKITAESLAAVEERTKDFEAARRHLDELKSAVGEYDRAAEKLEALKLTATGFKG